MKLRRFKKDVEFFVEEFLEDCSLFVLLNPEKAEKAEKIYDDSIALYNDLKVKANAVPEGVPAKAETPEDRAKKSKLLKAYYKGLREELIGKLNSLYEQLSAIAAN